MGAKAAKALNFGRMLFLIWRGLEVKLRSIFAMTELYGQGFCQLFKHPLNLRNQYYILDYQ